MSVTAADSRQRLKEIEVELSQAKDEERDARTVFEAARERALASPDNPAVVRSASAARAELEAARQHVEDIRDEEVQALRQVDRVRPGRGGWAALAHDLGRRHGDDRERSRTVELPLVDLMRPSMLAAVGVTPESGVDYPSIELPFMRRAADMRTIYQAFPRAEEVDPGTLGLTEWRQTGSRTVEGSIERDPVSQSEKATLDLNVELQTPALKQFAIVIDEIPNKLVDAVPAFQDFLKAEAQYQLDMELDAHVVAQLLAATPAHGKVGTLLVSQIRNAIAAMRTAGARPTVTALSGADAAELDLTQTGADEAFVFATRATGSASPLWGTAIVEAESVGADPLLIDPALAGVLYLGTAQALLDPFTEASKNCSRLRIEFDGLLHVRDIAGCYRVASE